MGLAYKVGAEHICPGEVSVKEGSRGKQREQISAVGRTQQTSDMKMNKTKQKERARTAGVDGCKRMMS